jgi:hypothetical protein
METIRQLAADLQELLLCDAAEIAQECGFEQRDSKLADGRFVQAMVLGCLAHPQPTLEQLAQTAASCGAPVQAQAIDGRLNDTAANCLGQVLDRTLRRVVSARPSDWGILQRFQGVLIQDSTTVTLPDACASAWPGCGGRTASGGQAAIKFQVRIDLKDGTLSGPWAGAGTTADARSRFQTDDLPPGSLEIADLGYFDLDKFARKKARGAYWLTRYQENTALWTEDERPLELSTLLRIQASDTAVVDQSILMGSTHRLRCRLVAIRVPAEQAAWRRQRMIEKARDKGRQPTAARLASCDWNLFVTDIPPALADAAAISVLARSRWQIECVFKLWKTGGGRLGLSRSHRPARVLCEVLATLIGLVIQHWLLVIAVWRHADRSLRKAAGAVRAFAASLAASLGDRDGLIGQINAVVERLSAAARLDKRKAKPNSHQLLETPTIYGRKLT